MGNIIKNLNHTAEEINDILASVSTKAGESELVNVKNDLNSLSTYVHEQFKKKTTLAEYGIEDANISETTITLGENSIEVATSEGLSQAITDLTALIEEKADKSALAVVENATKAGTVTLRAGKVECNVVVDGTKVNIPAYSGVVVRPSTGFYNSDLSFKDGSFVGCDFRADTTGWTSMASMFRNFGGLDIDVSNLNTSQVTSMQYMFLFNKNLISLDLGMFDTSQVTNMNGMFSGCSSLKSLNLSSFNTAKVTKMNGMFSGCSSLTSINVSGFDTSQVTTMQGMFRGCSSLEALDLSNFNTRNVTSMNSMFDGCTSLPSLNVSNFNTANVTDMSGMFVGLTKFTGTLDIRHFDMSKVSNLERFFGWLNSSAKVNMEGCDTSNVRSIQMWNGANCWQNLVGLDFGNVYSMFGIYPGNDCPTIVGDYTLDNVRNNNLYTYRNFRYSMNWSGFSKLNVQSFLAVINGLKDLTGQDSLTLTLPTRIKSSLTDDDIAKATDKNWIIVWK